MKKYKYPYPKYNPGIWSFLTPSKTGRWEKIDYPQPWLAKKTNRIPLEFEGIKYYKGKTFEYKVVSKLKKSPSLCQTKGGVQFCDGFRRELTFYRRPLKNKNSK